MAIAPARLSAIVNQSISFANLGISNLSKDVFFINGMSSPKIRHFLNNLCEEPGTRYFEIGTWCGSTLISALSQNHGSVQEAIAVDNFSKFQTAHSMVNSLIGTIENPQRRSYFIPPEGAGRTVKAEFLAKIEDFLQPKPSKFTFYDADCFDPEFLETLSTQHPSARMNVYFYDGSHQFEAQRDAFLKLDFMLDKTFIAIVDDWNLECVQEGTFEAFETLGYKILEQWVLPSNGNGDVANWWNGFFVAAIQKNKR